MAKLKKRFNFYNEDRKWDYLFSNQFVNQFMYSVENRVLTNVMGDYYDSSTKELYKDLNISSGGGMQE